MRVLENIKLDIRTNSNSRKARVVMVAFRVAHYLKTHKYLVVRVLAHPFLELYHVISVWGLGIEIPCKTKIGAGFNLNYGSAVTINGNAVIGNYVMIRQHSTIGNKADDLNAAPRIGDHVIIESNCVITGEIVIGNNVTIGAGCLVTQSIPSNSIVYGNPLKIVGKTIIGKVNPVNFKRKQGIVSTNQLPDNL